MLSNKPDRVEFIPSQPSSLCVTNDRFTDRSFPLLRGEMRVTRVNISGSQRRTTPSESRESESGPTPRRCAVMTDDTQGKAVFGGTVRPSPTYQATSKYKTPRSGNDWTCEGPSSMDHTSAGRPGVSSCCPRLRPGSRSTPSTLKRCAWTLEICDNTLAAVVHPHT